MGETTAVLKLSNACNHERVGTLKRQDWRINNMEMMAEKRNRITPVNQNVNGGLQLKHHGCYLDKGFTPQTSKLLNIL